MMDHMQIEIHDKVFVRRPFFEASAYSIARLREVLLSRVFKNAIWLASPEFYKELEKKGFDYDLLNQKERLSALKFFNRMSYRATPFGAFSGFGLAGWGNENKKGSAKWQDAYLYLLPSVQRDVDMLGAMPLQDNTRIALNPTLYALSTGWRYTRYETEKTGKLSFYVYLLQYNEADEMLLKFLAGGPVLFVELVAFLQELTDCTDEEARLHVWGLLDEQVLLSENSLSLLFDGRCDKKTSIAYAEDLDLKAVMSEQHGDSTGKTDGRAFYTGLEIENLNGVDSKWQRVIGEGLKALDLLAPAPPKNDLDKFREAFVQKFGERRVSLLEALDPDLGIAYDEYLQSEEYALLKGLDFEQPAKRADHVSWTPVHQLLLKVWLQNNRRNEWEPVELTAVNLYGLQPSGRPFPPSINVICSVSEGKLVYQNIGGATANALTGRFSAFSDDFEGFCKDVASRESAANPDVIFAEILQVSHRKIDNINRRKQVYDHVIPLNTFHGQRNCILPADLDVLVRGSELLLIQRSTGKRVIPRLPTAFNFHHNGMQLFRFLCALQYQSIRANFDFDPERLFPGLNFYPRIAYGESILSLARWHLSADEIKGLVKQPLSISRLHLFCRERGIPTKITIGRGDQQLVFNLASDEEALFFLECLQETSGAVVTEFLWNDSLGFNAQFVVSLLNKDRVYAPLQVNVDENSVVRDFPPGSEWVYMKIYATHQSIEQVLLNTLLPWIQDNRYRIRQWFFVRYHDTDSHLRLRVKTDPVEVKAIQFELQSLIAPVLAGGLVQRAYFDTYQREIERYSAELIGDVEEVFLRGSEVVGFYLAKMAHMTEEDLLWPVWHSYHLVNVFFKNDVEQVIILCQWTSEVFFKEHGGEKKLKRSMDERLRSLRAELMTGALDQATVEAALPKRLEISLRHLSDASAGKAEVFRHKLIADIVHMQVNRIFKSDQRRHETFIWHCLLKMAVTVSKTMISVVDPVIDDR